ncbi:unnamed protein product, partial [Chrysoparadoxa australica]
DGTGEGSLRDHVDLLCSGGGKVDSFWAKQLLRLDKREAKRLIWTLVPGNPLGFDAGPAMTQKGRLFEYLCGLKRSHPREVILCRVGEFYETYGVDSLMMIQYAGLNPMGSRAKAGCPLRNIQQTLDGLTGVGLSVVVVEEVKDFSAGPGPAKKRGIKTRAVAQVVTPGSPVYLHGLCMRRDDVPFEACRPYIGVVRGSSGFALVEVFADERLVRVSERLPEEAVRTMLASVSPVEPIFMQDVTSYGEWDVEQVRGFTQEGFVQEVQSRVKRRLALNEDEEFRQMRSPAGASLRPQSLHLPTAAQIGLQQNHWCTVPDLVSALLPPGAKAHCRRFLTRWLLLPPPYAIADSMQGLCASLAASPVGLPQSSAVPVGKAVSMLRAKECNIPLFIDLALCTWAMVKTLEDPQLETPSKHLLDVAHYQSGLGSDALSLCAGGKRVLKAVAEVVSMPYEGLRGEQDAVTSDVHGSIPGTFWARNEEELRGGVRSDHVIMRPAFKALEDSALHLCDVVSKDFPNAEDLTYDLHNNAIFLKKKPSEAALGDRADFIHPIDRNGKALKNRYTTPDVAAALTAYKAAVQGASEAAKEVLESLSLELLQDLPSVVMASHWAVIAQTAEAHTSHSMLRRWCLPTLKPVDDTSTQFSVKDLRPYWLAGGGPLGGVPNSFSLDGLFLLTAPNMSGKSTIMRSTMAAALLANAGLFIPASEATVPRYDAFFMRTSSHDVPSEGKSAFALEMDDMRVVLEGGTPRSLVMVDELGKGTSSRDGAGLSGALLEELDRMRVSGIFATHLHELFALPLSTRSVSYKRMGFIVEDAGHEKGQERQQWTFKLEDGQCTNSLALQTALDHSIPQAVVSRAQVLSTSFDALCRGPGGASNSSEGRGSGSVQGAALNGEALEEKEEQSSAIDMMSQSIPSSAAAQVLSTSTGVALEGLLHVKPQYSPPPQLEGRACVYILRARPKESDEIGRNGGGWWYIGESEALAQRLKQHRSRHLTVNIDAIVAPVSDKSAARAAETLAI